MSDSLFHRLGGENAVSAAVDVFYERILGDDALAPFFEGVDVDRLADKQRMFLSFALGAPTKWSGRSLRAAHQAAVGRGLSDEHFDRVAGHLVDTLDQLGVAKPLIDEVVAVVGATRDDVLNR